MNRRSLEEISSGNIFNIVSNDAKAIEDLGVSVVFFSFHFLDIAISLTIIWKLVAWQALLGACFMLVVAVYGSLSARKTAIWRRHASKLIDNRLEVMKEIVAGIRAVKMYAWEWNFRALVATMRRYIHILSTTCMRYRKPSVLRTTQDYELSQVTTATKVYIKEITNNRCGGREPLKCLLKFQVGM